MKAFAVLFAALLAVHAAVRADTPETEAETAPVPETVEVSAKKKPGSVPYPKLYRWQKMIVDALPPEPRHVDARFRASLWDKAAKKSGPPLSRVFVVSDTLDQAIPTDTGGFFLLPDLTPAQMENAVVMSEEKIDGTNITFAAVLRTGGKQAMPYRDFAHAVDEVKAATAKLPWYLRWFALRGTKFETASFCFKNGGSIRIDAGTYAADRKSSCVRLNFDRTKLEQNPDIEFVGELAYATLESTRPVE